MAAETPVAAAGRRAFQPTPPISPANRRLPPPEGAARFGEVVGQRSCWRGSGRTGLEAPPGHTDETLFFFILFFLLTVGKDTYCSYIHRVFSSRSRVCGRREEEKRARGAPHASAVSAAFSSPPFPPLLRAAGLPSPVRRGLSAAGPPSGRGRLFARLAGLGSFFAGRRRRRFRSRRARAPRLTGASPSPWQVERSDAHVQVLALPCRSRTAARPASSACACRRGSSSTRPRRRRRRITSRRHPGGGAGTPSVE